MVGLVTWYNAPFSMMIGVSFFFLLLQLIGGDSSDSDADLDLDTDLDFDADIDVDIDTDLDMDTGFGGTKDFEINTGADGDLDTDSPSIFMSLLGFVNVGRVPLSIVLMASFFTWGASGLLLNTGLKSIFNAYMPWFFALSLFLGWGMSLFGARYFSKFFGALFKETSAAIQLDDLVGCVGTVSSGIVPEFGQKNFGRANVYSSHGTLLRINCVTHENCLPPGKNQEIFVTGYDPVSKLHTVLLYQSEDFQGYLSGHKHEMRSFEMRLRASQKALQKKVNKEIV